VGTKKDESSAGRVCAAVFHHVTACSRLECVLKLNEPFIYLIVPFLGGRVKSRITETTDTESVDTGHDCILNLNR
jgi:hypothetical protein